MVVRAPALVSFFIHLDQPLTAHHVVFFLPDRVAVSPVPEPVGQAAIGTLLDQRVALLGEVREILEVAFVPLALAGRIVPLLFRPLARSLLGERFRGRANLLRRDSYRPLRS